MVSPSSKMILLQFLEILKGAVGFRRTFDYDLQTDGQREDMSLQADGLVVSVVFISVLLPNISSCRNLMDPFLLRLDVLQVELHRVTVKLHC